MRVRRILSTLKIPGTLLCQSNWQCLCRIVLKLKLDYVSTALTATGRFGLLTQLRLTVDVDGGSLAADCWLLAAGQGSQLDPARVRFILSLDCIVNILLSRALPAAAKI